MAPYGGTWLANGGISVVKGAWPGLVAFMRFPGRATAARYHPPEFREILPPHASTAVSAIVLIGSLPAD